MQVFASAPQTSPFRVLLFFPVLGFLTMAWLLAACLAALWMATALVTRDPFTEWEE